MSLVNAKLGWVPMPFAHYTGWRCRWDRYFLWRKKSHFQNVISLAKPILEFFPRPNLRLNFIIIKFDCLVLLLADELPQGPSAGKWTCVCASSDFGTDSHAFVTNCSTACDCRPGMPLVWMMYHCQFDRVCLVQFHGGETFVIIICFCSLVTFIQLMWLYLNNTPDSAFQYVANQNVMILLSFIASYPFDFWELPDFF